MAKETNQVLGHSDESDGIEEYDNPLPDWWVGLYILTVIGGVAYGLSYHFIQHDSQVKRYEAEMALAEERWPTPEAASFEMSDALVAEGAEVFAQTCVSCHAADLTGGIGVNLVDDEWIYGDDPATILLTISEGANNGMPAWGPVLGPHKVQAVAAFVVSKQGDGLVHATPAPVVEHTGPGEALTDADTEALVEVDDPIAAGEEIFVANCVACHLADLTGGVGPNLVDDEWIHGGELEDIRAVITDGVPEKGMITWGPILGAQKIEWVSLYVHSMAAE